MQNLNVSFNRAAFKHVGNCIVTGTSHVKSNEAQLIMSFVNFCIRVTFKQLRKYNVSDASLNDFDSQVFAKVIAAAADKLGANLVVLSHSSIGKGLLGRLAVRMYAA